MHSTLARQATPIILVRRFILFTFSHGTVLKRLMLFPFTMGGTSKLKPWFCNSCQTCFVSERGFSQHLNRVHGGELFEPPKEIVIESKRAPESDAATVDPLFPDDDYTESNIAEESTASSVFPLGANFDEDLMRAKLAWELRPLCPSRKNGKISYAPSLIGGAEDEGLFQMWSPQQSQFYAANATDAMSSQFGDVDSHLAHCNRMHDDSSLNSSLNSIFDCDAQLEKLQKECADQYVEQVHNKGKGCDDVWSPPRQEEVPIYDVRCLAKEPPHSTIHTGMFSVQDKHYLHLMRHLDAVWAPKHMFKTVLEWAKDASSDGFDFMQNHPDRNQFVEQLQKRFRLPPPTIVTIGLEYAQGSSQCHRSVDVVVWDVAWQIQRLMNDYYLMHPDNLALTDPKNPYEPYIPSKRGDEHQDGRLFQDAQKCLRIGPIDLVIGTELYGDRTHVDVRGRFTLEPWIGALSITNRKTRECWDAQFVLGCVTDVKLSSAKSKLLTGTRKGELQGIKVCNYHRQLNTIFRSYRQIQWGTEMWVAVGLKEELRNLILPVLTVKGDGASNNVVCGLMKGQN